MSIKDRTDSLDSIPDVDFIAKNGESDELAETNLNSPVISEFRLREMNHEMDDEPLLKTEKSRFVLFPIKHGDVST